MRRGSRLLGFSDFRVLGFRVFGILEFLGRWFLGSRDSVEGVEFRGLLVQLRFVKVWGSSTCLNQEKLKAWGLGEVYV